LSIFLDTSFILAFANDADKFHNQALELAESIKKMEFGSIFTSTYVFDESVTLALTKKNHSKALRLVTLF